MNYKNILIATENNVAITINRPTKLNALNTVTIQELHQAFRVRKLHDTIILGSGEKLLLQELILLNLLTFQKKVQLAKDKIHCFVENLKIPVYCSRKRFCTWRWFRISYGFISE
jgi:enoyl-CoA hydratase